jgi:hypothetical protein
MRPYASQRLLHTIRGMGYVLERAPRRREWRGAGMRHSITRRLVACLR